MNIYLWNTKNPLITKIQLINTILFSICTFVACMLIFSPLAPNISFYLRQRKQTPEISHTLLATNAQAFLPIDEDNMQTYAQESIHLAEQTHSAQFPTNLSIPSIQLDSKIHSGTSANLLYRGLWHKSSSGNPVEGSNMVITAHRFLYRGVHNTFYHLPKAEIGDSITIRWEGRDYHYQVTETKTVTPDQISIEAPTEEHQLTLYTCTPLWRSTHRFVVIAKPI
jgi:LPXTG-site transpeptidase (sortase) family protein